MPSAPERLLLDEPVLRHLERPCAAGAPARRAASDARRVGGHAFPLVGDDRRRPSRRLGQRGDVVERRRRRGRRPPPPARPATGRGSGTAAPSGMPASPSMRPSCPPPSTATTSPAIPTCLAHRSIRVGWPQWGRRRACSCWSRCSGWWRGAGMPDLLVAGTGAVRGRGDRAGRHRRGGRHARSPRADARVPRRGVRARRGRTRRRPVPSRGRVDGRAGEHVAPARGRGLGGRGRW